ncbi:MAG TPA: hypothetical protein VF312_01240, partial [Propionibacteriaceae bacterium]
MELWDRICTSDALRLSEVEERLAETEIGSTDPGQAWRGGGGWRPPEAPQGAEQCSPGTGRSGPRP